MFLKELTELNGVSGDEEKVCLYIKNLIKDYTSDITIDTMGNMIAYKKGKSSTAKVMLSAHMDEIGLMVTSITDTGMLKFKTVGGIDERILLGKKVLVGDAELKGVIGVKPIHMQEKEERGNNIKLKSMYIDIGLDTKEEAQKVAKIGEFISFHSLYQEFGEGCVKAKALDDRVGCAVLIEALKQEHEFDLYACFTVQEEVGLRGSTITSYKIKPDVAFVIEGTTCSDVPGVEAYEYSTKLGDGAAITFMDRTSYGDRGVVDFIVKVANKHNIKYQFKQTNSGGNDAGRIQQSGSGVKVASISVPCRYIHSPVSVMNKEDFHSVENLIDKILYELNDKNTLKTLIDGGLADV